MPEPVKNPMQRILLVEDERVNREMVTTYLTEHGFTVDTAVDGVIALDMLHKDSDYGAIITDRIMPNMDGMALLSEIRKTPRLQGIPIIMQTGASLPVEVIEGIKSGVYYYLVKPYEEQALIALVRSAIDSHIRENVFRQNATIQHNALNHLRQGRFEFRDLADAERIATFLGSLYHRPELAMFGLYELLVNAVEHGNLEIGFAEKSRLLEQGNWEQEVTMRLALPENATKTVSVEFTHENGLMDVMITDMGKGFNWRPYLEIEPARATQSNGRGIAKANQLSFDTMTFMGNGNQLRVTAKSV